MSPHATETWHQVKVTSRSVSARSVLWVHTRTA